MIRFESDYLEGAHPRVLAALVAANEVQTPGYSEDSYCERAREMIRRRFSAPQAAVHFLVGGTQVNAVFIRAVLRPHQGVLCAATGHINAHETGAIEAGGHKVLPLPTEDGKITPEAVQAYYDTHWADTSHEHIVQPGMVYISNPTENGTLYTRTELMALYRGCHALHLPLYVDGARLGYGLMAGGDAPAPADYAQYCDAFTIGGTKCGALFGEALVINDPALATDIRYLIKQSGGLLAKGRLLGLQFSALLEDDLYFQIAAEADRLALRLRDGFAACGYPMLYRSPTNQQYPILPDALLARLGEKYSYSYWQRIDETHSAVRFCTSPFTREETVDGLLADVAALTADLQAPLS